MLAWSTTALPDVPKAAGSRLRTSLRSYAVARGGSTTVGTGSGKVGGTSVGAVKARSAGNVARARMPTTNRRQESSDLTRMLHHPDLGLPLDALPLLSGEPSLFVHGQRGPELDRQRDERDGQGHRRRQEDLA